MKWQLFIQDMYCTCTVSDTKSLITKGALLSPKVKELFLPTIPGLSLIHF